ncbi:MAG: SEC-C domain-containing protein [Acidobacteriia bacterium]|nr:SEC-C domain-containing protein [Terriglobia bacterium]
MSETCVRLARQVPHSTLQPETLVWKLGALVQYLATGAMQNEHALKAEELQPLLEQLITQLQNLPEALDNYRPQESEPAYQSEELVRLLTGFSGSGKTSWVGEVGAHTADPLLYFDVAEMPSAGIPSALAREMAAYVLPDTSPERQKILLPGVSGIQSLRVIDRYVAEHRKGMTIVFDNAHRVANDVMVEIVRSMRSVKWIVLAQDWPGSEFFVTSTGARAETLSGWSRDTIAQEATAIGCFGSIEDFERLHDLTGALPLFVRDASRICKEAYQGNVASYVADLSDHVSIHTTSQEVIVSQVLERLSEDTKAFASLLAIFTVPFHRDVVLQVTAPALGLTRTQAARHLHALHSWGIIRSSAGGDVILHDSFRLLVSELLSEVPAAVVASAREELYQFVWAHREGGGPDRFRLLARLMFETKRIQNLVDLLTNTAEIVLEFGLEDEMSDLLMKAANDTSLSPEDRFWAEDTLAYWAINRKNVAAARPHIENIQALLKEFVPSETIRTAALSKELLFIGLESDLTKLQGAYRRALASSQDAMARRIVTYNYAHGLLTSGRPDLAHQIATRLVGEYYQLLGISINDVLFHKLYETKAKIRNFDENQDEVKRLADSLDLQASAAARMGQVQPFAKLHAHKFFLLSSSFISAVRVGLDFVHECLTERGDAVGARDFTEQFLLPLIHDQGMIGALVPVRCQYAVVLAFCGEFHLASSTLQELGPYIVEGTEQAAEYETQARKVDRIKAGELRLRSPRQLPALKIPKEAIRKKSKVGRNDLCPCGSGLKFKRCCGS